MFGGRRVARRTARRTSRRNQLKRFVVTVEGPNLEDLEEIELPSLPQEGDPIETRFGTCVVVRAESVADGSGREGRIVCRMPQAPDSRRESGRHALAVRVEDDDLIDDVQTFRPGV